MSHILPRPDRLPRLPLLSSLHLLLAPGSPADTHGSEVVAVVGQIEPGSIAATVAAWNTSSASYNREEPIKVNGVVLLEDGVVADMLVASDKTTLP